VIDNALLRRTFVVAPAHLAALASLITLLATVGDTPIRIDAAFGCFPGVIMPRSLFGNRRLSYRMLDQNIFT
jgi:hypothetical protein